MNSNEATHLTSLYAIWHHFCSLLKMAGRGATTPPLIGTSVDELYC